MLVLLECLVAIEKLLIKLVGKLRHLVFKDPNLLAEFFMREFICMMCDPDSSKNDTGILNLKAPSIGDEL